MAAAALEHPYSYLNMLMATLEHPQPSMIPGALKNGNIDFSRPPDLPPPQTTGAQKSTLRCHIIFVCHRTINNNLIWVSRRDIFYGLERCARYRDWNMERFVMRTAERYCVGRLWSIVYWRMNDYWRSERHYSSTC
jgi:hypothetical protein